MTRIFTVTVNMILYNDLVYSALHNTAKTMPYNFYSAL